MVDDPVIVGTCDRVLLEQAPFKITQQTVFPSFVLVASAVGIRSSPVLQLVRPVHRSNVGGHRLWMLSIKAVKIMKGSVIEGSGFIDRIRRSTLIGPIARGSLPSH